MRIHYSSTTENGAWMPEFSKADIKKQKFFACTKRIIGEYYESIGCGIPEFKDKATKISSSHCRVSDSETIVFNSFNILFILFTLFALLYSQSLRVLAIILLTHVAFCCAAWLTLFPSQTYSQAKVPATSQDAMWTSKKPALPKSASQINSSFPPNQNPSPIT